MSRTDRAQELLEIVGANVRKFRRERGLTQEALAELVGVEIRHLRFIEHAESGPSFDLLVGLADALDVDPADLFGEVEIEDIPRGRPRKKPVE